MSYERVDYKFLKNKVGIDDIAFHLGYRLDRRAGVGKYIEMVLPDASGNAIDTLVIKNPKDKATQTYFRRNGAKGGDVISLIRENINRFNVSGRNEWDVVSQVMAKFANEPIPEYGDSSYLYKAGYTENNHFDPIRYETQPIDNHIKHTLAFFQKRGLTAETMKDFAPNLRLIKDTKMTQYPYFNLGFPYRRPGDDKIVGYEIRGFGGFKNKAAGTDSSSAAWIADLSKDKDPNSIKNVFFAESAFDMMAFYQANKARIDKESSVFVSIGGTFSDKQITNIMQYYSEARAMDCFDNDLPGRIYGIRMAALLEKIPLNIVKEDNFVKLQSGGKNIIMQEDNVSLAEFAKNFPLRYKVGQAKAPKNYKDWNDVVMGKPLYNLEMPTKHQRNEILEQKRMKLA